LRQVYENLVAPGPPERLQSGIAYTDAIEFSAQSVETRLVSVLHIHQGSAAEFDSPIRTTVHDQRNDARYAEDQRKRNEIPLLAEEIDIWISKKFPAKTSGFNVARFQSFKDKRHDRRRETSKHSEL